MLAALGVSALSFSLFRTPSAQAREIETMSIAPDGAVYRRGSIIFRLPRSNRRRMAWTVDDGTSAEMINDYLQFVKKHNLRLTFFVYSGMSGWRKLAPKIKPLVQTGQIQIANHTARHPDLRKLSTSQIQKELWDCHKFILKHYGIDARPFFRPPYGAINQHVVEAAAEIGYTSPVMWSGSLADAARISTSGIWNKAKLYVGNEIILLSHANNTQTAHLFERILARIQSKHLKLVTLNDALAPAPKPPSIVRATVNGTSVTVTWSAVTNAQFYQVVYSENGVTKRIVVNGRSHIFTDLSDSHTYQFRVCVSVFGVKSVLSAPTSPVRIEPKTPSPSPSSA